MRLLESVLYALWIIVVCAVTLVFAALAIVLCIPLAAVAILLGMAYVASITFAPKTTTKSLMKRGAQSGRVISSADISQKRGRTDA